VSSVRRRRLLFPTVSSVVCSLPKAEDSNPPRPSNLSGPGDSSLIRFVAGYARSPLGKVFRTEIYLLLLSLSSRITWYLKMEYFLCGRNLHNCKRLIFRFHVDVISELCCTITLHFASFIMMGQGNGLCMWI
jgi:hypothetical protein